MKRKGRTGLKTRIVAALITVMTVLSVCAAGVSAASSAFSALSSSAYAKVYTLSSSGRTTPYTSSALTVRGTASYGASSSSYIDNGSDEMYLYSVGTGANGAYGYVGYPTSKGYVSAYIPLSAITQASLSGHASGRATGRFYCAKRQGAAVSSSYYVDPGDTVYLISRGASMSQILYPTSGGKWRIAFAKTADIDRYVNFGGTAATASVSSQRVTLNGNGTSATINGVSVQDGTTFYTYSSSGAASTSGQYSVYRYVWYNGQLRDVNSCQCMGFAYYIQLLCFGSHSYSVSTTTSERGYGDWEAIRINSWMSAENVRYHVLNGVVEGTHIRYAKGHSISILTADANGCWYADANSDGRNTIRIRWASYQDLADKGSISYIEYHR